MGDVPDPNPPKISEAEDEHAAFAMTRLVRQYPGQITIVCLAPLTNLAMATRLDPYFRKNVKNIIWIGGSVEGVGNVKPGIEFNAYFDPGIMIQLFNLEYCFILVQNMTEILCFWLRLSHLVQLLPIPNNRIDL